MTKNQSKLRLIESDLLSYHVRRMDQRIGEYTRQLIAEQNKDEPDADLVFRLKTAIERDELSKITPDVTEREVLIPLREKVANEVALDHAHAQRLIRDPMGFDFFTLSLSNELGPQIREAHSEKHVFSILPQDYESGAELLDLRMVEVIHTPQAHGNVSDEESSPGSQVTISDKQGIKGGKQRHARFKPFLPIKPTPLK